MTTALPSKPACDARPPKSRRDWSQRWSRPFVLDLAEVLRGKNSVLEFYT